MAPEFIAGELIPGLPDEVSELCLLRLPFPCHALLRSVSPSWNRTLSNPSFFATKSSLSLTKPYLLVLVKDRMGRKIQWRCLDPVSKNWCRLPPMPIPDADLWEPASVASSVAKEKSELYVFRGDSKNYVMVYSLAMNSWKIGNHSMKPGGTFFTSAAIGGKVYAFSHDDRVIGVVGVQCYDPVDYSLVDMAETTGGMTSSYDSVVVGQKVHVTERWDWPIEVIPDGKVYDTKLDTWQDMPVGMREGWTGSAASLGPNLFLLNETGDRKVKVYDHATDSWVQVKGNGIPKLVKKPYTVAADEETGKIYVVGSELNVAIATLVEVGKKKWEVEWDVVKVPDAISQFSPCDSQIFYA